MTDLWTPSERAAWTPPEDISPSQWAERYRVLPGDQSPRPGPWRNANAPYLSFLMDVTARPGIAQINIVKAAQGGISEAARKILGYYAHLDPEPAGLALPSRDKGRKIVNNRLIPMLHATEPLRKLMTAKSTDVQSEQIKLANGWLLHLMWSGSATAMASDPMRFVINDEVDKFLEWTGREADPVSLTRKRLRAFGDRGLQINISTPTTRYGKIWRLYETSSFRLAYFVPCPHCGYYQRLDFDSLKWNKGDFESRRELADHLEHTGDVWYQCADCGKPITPAQRPAMVRAGRWRSADDAPLVDSDGEPHVDAEDIEAWPRGTRLGLHIPAFYFLWQSWEGIAAEFLLAVDDAAKLYDFKTETEGLPFESQIDTTAQSQFEHKSQTATIAEGILPEWTRVLLATVDTQHDHFYAVVRAWGIGMRSHRVWHGQLESFADLDRVLLANAWPWETDRPPAQVGLLYIDTGGTRQEEDVASRTMQVYTWALRNRARVRPIKGWPRPQPGVFLKPGRAHIEQGPPARRGKRQRPVAQNLRLWLVDTHHFGDELADLVNRPPDEETGVEVWTLNTHNDADYNKHLSNVIKIPERHGNTIRERWVPKSPAARIDYWDCEVYQIAAAYLAQVHLLTDIEPDDPPEPAAAPSRPRARPRQGRDPWQATPFKI